MRLIDDLKGHRAELLLVRLPVVRAEQQVRTTIKHDTHVRLRTATIASVSRRERGGCESGVHMSGTSWAGYSGLR